MSQKERKDPIRAFIAVELPPPIREALGEVQRAMREAGAEAKWVRPDSIHLTLKFLGNIRAEKLSAIRSAMEAAVRGTEPLKASVAGVGAFPNERRPRVLWVGLDEPTGELEALHRRLEAALRPLGFKPEGRPFRPHLTMARIRSPARGARGGAIARALDAQRSVILGKITIGRIVLYQSTLKPTGAVYTPLEEVALGA